MKIGATQHHKIVDLPSAERVGQTVPCVFVPKEDGLVLKELWVLFHKNEFLEKSNSWRKKLAKTVALFFDFFRASGRPDFSNLQVADRLVDGFLHAVIFGTIQKDGTDEIYGLYWRPASQQVAEERRYHLKTFLRTLSDLVDDGLAPNTRFAKAAVSSLHFEKRRARSLLYHIAKAPKNLQRGCGSRGRSFSLGKKNARPFPHNALVKLIYEGCRRNRSDRAFFDNKATQTLASEYNLNLLMAVILMAGGGIRKSELFHIFLRDVEGETVWLYDPEYGRTDRVSRADFLRDEFKLLPRNRVDGQFHAGWKRLLLLDEFNNRSQIHFLPHYRTLFSRVFQAYRLHVLPKQELNHPYLFISTDAQNYGERWTIGGLNQAFSRAMQKIRIEKRKEDGTHIHGLRHSYGQSLVSMGLSPLIIQNCLHHVSIESQAVYTRPSAEKVNETLQRAAEVMNGTALPPKDRDAPDLLNYRYASDPAGIFAPYCLGLENDRL